MACLICGGTYHNSENCPSLSHYRDEKVEPVVVIVNGYPRSGKDTFCEVANEKYYTVNHSTVDTVKDLANQMGWNGMKTPYNRNMLSALKDFYVKWFDGTFEEITTIIKDAREIREEHFIFIHAREPEEIERVAEWCDNINQRVYTVFIERPDVVRVHGNHADANVTGYEYDIYIDNDGTLEEFHQKSLDILDSMRSNTV